MFYMSKPSQSAVLNYQTNWIHTQQFSKLCTHISLSIIQKVVDKVFGSGKLVRFLGNLVLPIEKATSN